MFGYGMDGMGAMGVGVMGVSGLLVIGLVVLVVVLVVNGSRRTEPGGYPPAAPPQGYAMTGQAPPAPSVGPPPRTVEARLAELDELARRGVVSADEHAAARARILGEL